jgi:hypothetical protein
MAHGTSPNIPNFRIYGGASPSSCEDGANPPQTFYAGCGWLSDKFGLYLFVIGATSIRNIPLDPFTGSRGVLEADSRGLALTSTYQDKPIRYEIPEYVMPAGGAGTVLIGEAADQQARNAIAALEARVGRLEVEERSDDQRDAQQAGAIKALELHDREVDQRIVALLASGRDFSLEDMRQYLWNDRFVIDLFYDIVMNRKDAGIRGAIRALVAEELAAKK